jgi:hypothetical protein
MSDQSIVGDLINFRGLVYSPINEQGVVFLFGKVAQDLNMYVEEIKPGFPDCIGRRFNGKGWERVRIEFEFLSSNFKLHKHDPKGCDLVVCWEHDWPGCPVEVIALKEIIPGLPNASVSRPDSARDIKQESDLEKFLAGLDPHIRKCYKITADAVRALGNDIWAKFNGRDMVTFYSPKRVFLYLKFRKRKGVRLMVFTRGEAMPGVKQFDYENGGAKWGLFMLSQEKQSGTVEKIVKTAFERITEAIKNNENTGWYAAAENDDDDDGEDEQEAQSASKG